MNLINKWGRKVYSTLKGVPGAAIIMQLIYHKGLPLIKPEMRSYPYDGNKEEPILKERSLKKALNELTIAIICDEMTFKGFETECQCVFVTPSNWMTIFRERQPDLFFCESAWSGIERYPNCWRGKIYKTQKAKFENRKDLKNILDFCRKSQIPTVFWNKEDPTYFGDSDHDFVDTALLFDYIYTTAEECVEKYRALGHSRVNTLMFGFSPKLFNPIGKQIEPGKAVFAGSWYQDQAQRCKDMKEMFEDILRAGLFLEIYDRHWNSENPINQYPEQYKKYLHPGVSFGELKEILKTAQFGININTVKESKTMFARRVFEMMASNLMVISNESVGLKEMFKERIWFVDEPDKPSNLEAVCRENLRDVFIHHTCRQRLLQIGTEIGVVKEQHPPVIFIIYEEASSTALSHFNRIPYTNKYGLIFKNNRFYSLEEETYWEGANDTEGFFIWLSSQDQKPDLEFMITQFSYIEETVGIREGAPKYSFTTDTFNHQTLFHMSLFGTVHENRKIKIKKYLI